MNLKLSIIFHKIKKFQEKLKETEDKLSSSYDKIANNVTKIEILIQALMSYKDDILFFDVKNLIYEEFESLIIELQDNQNSDDKNYENNK